MSSFLNEIAHGKVYFSSLVFLCACCPYFLWLLAPLGGKVDEWAIEWVSVTIDVSRCYLLFVSEYLSSSTFALDTQLSSLLLWFLVFNQEHIMFSVLAVKLWYTAKVDKYLTITWGLRAIRNKSSPCKNSLNRCDWRIMKLKGKIILRRESILPFESANYLDPKM